MNVLQLRSIKRLARDKREPGRVEKQRLQVRFALAIRRMFARQRERIRAWAATQKALVAMPEDLLSDDLAEILMMLTIGARGGVGLVSNTVNIGVDWTMANARASAWAREYAYSLVRGINQTTITAMQNAISAYIETPGMTLDDLMRLLPFDTDRALRIAVTEVTRAYAQGQRAAGEELRAQFPDVSVVTIWHTENDDRTCEICAPLDGQEVSDNNLPPAHPNCRCWVTVRTRIDA